MGRGKLQLKRIEDKKRRHVTFSKRRSGLIKKAKELSVLCDVDVAVFVFSGKGKFYEFSTADSLRKILQRCQIPKEADIACGQIPKEADIACGSALNTEKRQMNKGDDTNLLQAVQRYLEELKVEQLNAIEITQLEHKLDAILHQLKMKKVQIPAMEKESSSRMRMDDDHFHYQPQNQEDNNPLQVYDMEEDIYDKFYML